MEYLIRINKGKRTLGKYGGKKMKKVSSDKITYHQFMYIIVGTMIGTAILSLPNQMAKAASQDGWISVLIGGIYPLYIVSLAIYISKRFPNDDILSVSKKCFGKFIGSIAAMLFSLQFFIDMASVTAGFTNVSRVYIVPFLTPIKLIVIILLIGLYGTYQGLKIIGRINEVVFYFMILVLFIPLIALRDGSVLNVSPFLGSGVNNILKGSMQAGFAFIGVEIIFLIYPSVSEKEKIKGAALKSVAIIAFIYTFITFMTIFYIGPDVILKPHWSVMVLNETVNLPFINSFRFIFMYLWSVIIFKTVINMYYSVTYGISNSFIKLNQQRICFIIYPVFVYVVYRYGNEGIRRQVIGRFGPAIGIFNLVFITLIAIIVHFKKSLRTDNP
jgi:spore germination protein (amino acid permease)